MAPERRAIRPVSDLDATVDAPPSKAHTLRALIIGATAAGQSTIERPLLAADQHHAIDALRSLGAEITVDEDASEVTIEGCDGSLEAPDEPVFIGESGTTARILTALIALGDGPVTLDGAERMREARPVGDLLDALERLGVRAEAHNDDGCLPVTVEGPIEGGHTELRGDKSSQYFSALLIAGPYADRDVTIETVGELRSKPYIDITIEMMRAFGVDASHEEYEQISVEAGQRYEARRHRVEGDFSNAAYFFAAAAVTGGRVEVRNLDPESRQGDKVFLDLIERMGCDVAWDGTTVTVTGGDLAGIEADMEDYPDIALPMSVVAAYADGESRFTDIGHLKYKESDRLQAPVTELQKMGIDAEATDDAIIVQGGEPGGATVDTYNDHRMAMSFAVAGLGTEGQVLKDPGVVNKSFPNFYEVLEANFY